MNIMGYSLFCIFLVALDYSVIAQTNQCSPGEWAINGLCRPCPHAMYMNEPDKCARCPDGHTTLEKGSTSSSDCILCPAGTQPYQPLHIPDDWGTCKPCPVNYYKEAGGINCTRCPEGTVTDMEGATKVTYCTSTIVTTMSSTKAIEEITVYSSSTEKTTAILFPETSFTTEIDESTVGSSRTLHSSVSTEYFSTHETVIETTSDPAAISDAELNNQVMVPEQDTHIISIVGPVIGVAGIIIGVAVACLVQKIRRRMGNEDNSQEEAVMTPATGTDPPFQSSGMYANINEQGEHTNSHRRINEEPRALPIIRTRDGHTDVLNVYQTLSVNENSSHGNDPQYEELQTISNISPSYFNLKLS